MYSPPPVEAESPVLSIKIRHHRCDPVEAQPENVRSSLYDHHFWPVMVAAVVHKVPLSEYCNLKEFRLDVDGVVLWDFNIKDVTGFAVLNFIWIKLVPPIKLVA